MDAVTVDGMAALEVPEVGEKCSHGVRIAKSDSWARYCCVCNPGMNGILGHVRPVVVAQREPRTLDTEDFMALPLHERIREFTFAEGQ